MQVLETAQALAASGRVSAFRAGIWKPRTRPGSFEGIGGTALDWLVAARAATGLPIMTEVANAQHVEACLKAGLDAVWIGARTTVNPFYVQEIAEALRGVDLPVWVKNPIHSDVGLWIGALERLDKVGIRHLAAVHRGFYADRPEPFRNDPKWELSFALRTRGPDVPIVCDPSHIAGTREKLGLVAQQALDLGLSGLMVEVHPDPEHARSDAEQQLTPGQFTELMDGLIFRQAKPTPDMQDCLEEWRDLIDQLDEEIAQKLGSRMDIAERIGDHKRTNQVAILQPERWERIMQRQLRLAGHLGLSPAFVQELMDAIHRESIRRQSGELEASAPLSGSPQWTHNGSDR
jgi:chorismate mutase